MPDNVYQPMITKYHQLFIANQPDGLMRLVRLYGSSCQKPHDLVKKNAYMRILSHVQPHEKMILTEALVNCLASLKDCSNLADRTQLLAWFRCLVTSPEFYKLIPESDLYRLGQYQLFYREVVLIMMRQHCAEHGYSDPFSEADFHSEWLSQSDAAQSALIVSQRLVSMPTLPANKLSTLGKTPEIARRIRKDIAAHPDHFFIESMFADKHESLRSEIAHYWQHCFENSRMSVKMEAKVLPILLRMKSKYAEFSTLNIRAHRSQRAKAVPQQSLSSDKLVQTLGAALVCGTLGWYFAPASLAVAGVTKGRLAVGSLLGLYALHRSNQSNTNAPAEGPAPATPLQNRQPRV